MCRDRGTFRGNCVNLSGVGFRLKVCVHSPGEQLRLGCTAMWHTLARFLRLVGVNAAVYRVYYGAGNKRASLERYSCAPTFVAGWHATPTRLVTDWVCVTDVHSAELSNCWMNINNHKSRKRHRQISNFFASDDIPTHTLAWKKRLCTPPIWKFELSIMKKSTKCNMNSTFETMKTK